MAVSGGFLAASHRPDFLRSPIEARFSEMLGADVRFGTIAPYGLQSFRLTDLTVEFPLEDNTEARFRARSAVVQFSPLDLGQGRVRIRAIHLDGAWFDVNLDGPSRRTAVQLAEVMRPLLETPGLSVHGRNGVMRVYNQPGAPPLMLGDVAFDIERPYEAALTQGRFHAQLGDTASEWVEAHFRFANTSDFDVFVRGNRIGRQAVTRLLPAASGRLLAGVFSPEARITRVESRWLIAGAASFEGVEVSAPWRAFDIGDGRFQGAAVFSQDARELVISHARIDSPNSSRAAHGTLRFTDENTQVDLEINEIQRPPVAPLYQLTGR